MALSERLGYSDGVSFDGGEWTGAVGDSVTVLPIVVALAALTPVSLAHALLFFGVFQVVWGLVYGLPLSVEPMKALAGLALAGALTAGEYVAAGLLAGGVLVVAAATGALSRVERFVGRPVIRGIQLAVALVLLRAGVDLGLADPPLALAAAGVAGVVALAGFRRGAALAALGLGLALALARTGAPAASLPGLSVFPAAAPALTADALSATTGQLAMTVGNAAVATSLLLSDLFDADVSADRLAGSMGAMCLAAVPLGGVPMCHGSGGLAGKHAFGARTGGANLVLGGLYLAAVPFAGVVAAFPMAVLGVVLAVVAVHLGRRAVDVEGRGALALVALVGVVGLAWTVGAAFLVGLVADAARRRLWADAPATN
ncbi:putative sulfate/molybdate transporter [Halobaculum lipolyticum]|uniref:putative sulfate/molybdate transporter n=1 Tax=Halobaculum lipolyticum TaxID=3032001 RepID=UPI0024C3C701|nr:putative sulfate/molybdate transporter [Halobaculum sp. DT31]